LSKIVVAFEYYFKEVLLYNKKIVNEENFKYSFFIAPKFVYDNLVFLL